MVVPYTNGLSKSFKNVCGKVRVQAYFKGDNTIQNLLVAPKDRDKTTQESGVIYRFKCYQVGCEEECINELARTFKERFKEHVRACLPHL